MAQHLANIADKAKRSDGYPYFNDFAIEQYEMQLRGMPAMMRNHKFIDYLLLLLMKGRNEDCIHQINGHLRQLKMNKRVTPRNVAYYKIMALAYLRDAEIVNCIEGHSSAACVVPLSESAVHKINDKTKMAAKLYQDLCDFEPDNLQSRWFLNLAHMAMGTYPDAVPSEYLISEEQIRSDIQFPHFENIAMQTGTAVNNHAGGCSIEDFNNDGLLDIFTTSYSLAEESVLLINHGDGTFKDKTHKFGLAGYVGGLNNIHGDFNNDGFVDIFITRGAWLKEYGKLPNSLLMNQEGRGFRDVTSEAGLGTMYPTGTAAAADFNLDGHLDLFIGNESLREGQNPCELYLNNGDGTFTDVADKLGLQVFEFVKGAVWGDINNDMLPDLFLSVYHGKNKLFLNKGGKNIDDWIFEDISELSGVTEPILSFPTWFWDYNNDGLQDLMVCSYDNASSSLIPEKCAKDYLGIEGPKMRPMVYRNLGGNRFEDQSVNLDLDLSLFPMGANFGDLNNDGYQDFYLGTGEFNLWAQVPNRMFLNHAGSKFSDVTTSGGFGQIQKGHGVAFGDLDNDGDQDVYHQVGGAAESDVFFNMLFENPGFGHQWISMDLEGFGANRSAIGARIELSCSDGQGNRRNIFHWVGTGGSFGANSLRAEIGLGEMTNVDTLSVYWPDVHNSRDDFYNVSSNAHYRLRQEGQELILLTTPSLNLAKGEVHTMH